MPLAREVYGADVAADGRRKGGRQFRTPLVGRPALLVAVAFSCFGLSCSGSAGHADSLLTAASTSSSTTTPTSPTVNPTTVTSSPSPADNAVQHVSVAAGGGNEYLYDTSLTALDAGPVEITLTNGGTVEHQAMVIRLADTVDLAQFSLDLLAAPTRLNIFRLAQGFGGPNGVWPNGAASTTQTLTPGNYAMVCLLPGTGLPNAARGMIRPFTVRARTTPTTIPATGGDLPEFRLDEFRFVGPSELRAGQTVRVVNVGRQTHELGLYRLEGAATPEDLVAAFERADPQPPTKEGAGLGGVRPGGEATFVLPRTPGSYALVCFFPDTSGSGKTHVHLGMLSRLTLS